MRKFNFTRPLLIIAVALFAKTASSTISIMLGASQEAASNISFGVMMIAALFTFSRLNRSRNKK
jgi:hypothetical protein